MFSLSPKNDEWNTKIDALAERLGVEPLSAETRSDGQMRYLISVNNGTRFYNLLDMINAVLNRIDEATASKR